MEETLKDVLTILGGTTVILGALFGFIGKLWLTRIIDTNKHELEKQLLTMQNALDTTNKKLDAELQKSIHISKVQFEHEFSIYKDAWDALVDLRMATLNLRPTLDQINPEQSEEDRMQERLSAFYEPFKRYRDCIEKNKPFYSVKVYESLYAILDKCHDESIGYEYKERERKEYYQEARKNRETIIDLIDMSCDEIRTRINEVTVT